MKISAIVNESNTKFEEQKRYLQRKEAKETYKKNASYTQANPMLAILEDLLSGKTEKELYENQESAFNESEDTISIVPKSELVGLPLNNLSPLREKELDENILSNQLQTELELASGNEDEFNRFADENFEINIPDRFLKDFNSVNFNRLDIKKSIDTLLLDKSYKKAISTYNQQMEIARTGYVTKPTQYSISI